MTLSIEKATLERLDSGWLPTEDDLPDSDGVPMESDRHYLQMVLLRETLTRYWDHREDFCIGTNMFLYYSLEQVRREAFIGPDVFVALGVPRRSRKSWVSWNEGKVPDVVIELLSNKTQRLGRTYKKELYQNELRIREYFWWHPWRDDWQGFRLVGGVYEPIPADEQRRRMCEQTGLLLGPWEGRYDVEETRWLRWFTPDGLMLPTNAEAGAAERQRAEGEQQRAEAERQRAEAERQRAETERQRTETQRERANTEHLRAERLAQKLRELGIDPDA
jgi:Uma2 family endonuclease